MIYGKEVHTALEEYVRDNKPGVDLSRTIYAPSGEEVTFNVNFGVEFFRPFYGL